MSPTYLVAILCAGWCSTCARFRPDFLQADLAGVASHRLWIDIEDHADVLPDSLDLVSLPTLLVASTPSDVAFFGPVRPDVGIVGRLARTRGQCSNADELLASIVARWLQSSVMDSATR